MAKGEIEFFDDDEEVNFTEEDMSFDTESFDEPPAAEIDVQEATGEVQTVTNKTEDVQKDTKNDKQIEKEVEKQLKGIRTEAAKAAKQELKAETTARRRDLQDQAREIRRQKHKDMRQATQRRKDIRSQSTQNKISTYALASAMGLPGYVIASIADKYVFKPAEAKDIAAEVQYQGDYQTYVNEQEDRIIEERRQIEDEERASIDISFENEDEIRDSLTKEKKGGVPTSGSPTPRTTTTRTPFPSSSGTNAPGISNPPATDLNTNPTTGAPWGTDPKTGKPYSLDYYNSPEYKPEEHRPSSVESTYTNPANTVNPLSSDPNINPKTNSPYGIDPATGKPYSLDYYNSPDYRPEDHKPSPNNIPPVLNPPSNNTDGSYQSRWGSYITPANSSNLPPPNNPPPPTNTPPVNGPPTPPTPTGSDLPGLLSLIPIIKEGMDMSVKLSKGMGESARGTIDATFQDSGTKGLSQGFQAGVTAVESLPIVGQIAEVFAQPMVEAVKTFEEAVGQFESYAKKDLGFSPDALQASVESKIAKLVQAISIGEKADDSKAAIIEGTTKLDMIWSELKADVVVIWTPILTKGLTILASIAQLLKAIMPMLQLIMVPLDLMLTIHVAGFELAKRLLRIKDAPKNIQGKILKEIELFHTTKPLKHNAPNPRKP